MGTTIVLALFRGDRVYITGIGDSRAYRLRDGRLERLTEDHSLADALVKAGTIRPEEVENHKFRNVLYLYLGCKDARDGPEEIRTLDVRRGDVFLLATDGLTSVVRDEVLAEVLRHVARPPARRPCPGQSCPGEPVSGQHHLCRHSSSVVGCGPSGTATFRKDGRDRGLCPLRTSGRPRTSTADD